MNIPELAEHSAQRLGECRVMVHEGKEYTNHQFLNWGKRLQRGLVNIDVNKGDVVGMCLINNPLVHPIFQGIFRTGAVAVPVMFALTAPELNFILSDAKAIGVVTDTFSLEKIRDAVKGLDHIKWIAVLDGDDEFFRSVPEYSIKTLMDNEPMEILPYINEYDLAMMLYTSGTTGKPKGVMLTHKNLYFTAKAALEGSRLDQWKVAPVFINALPLAHIFGVGIMNMNFMLPEHIKDTYTILLTRFDAEKYMQLIQEHKVSRTTLVPAMIALILNHPKTLEYDLTSLKEVSCGSAPLPIEQARAFCRLVEIDRIKENYGCTETGNITTTPLNEPFPEGSVGKPCSGIEMAIFDENDNPLSPGEKGEIVMKGPTMMKGYLNRPEETTRALRHGWMHTGDVGYINEDGFLFISDRIKDMIIRGGENIYPGELEKVIYQHPAVAEATVIGKPDSVYGEKVIAFVVTKQGESVTSEEVLDFMRLKVTKFKLPAEIRFIDALPKTPVGKVLKRELKEMVKDMPN